MERPDHGTTSRREESLASQGQRAQTTERVSNSAMIQFLFFDMGPAFMCHYKVECPFYFVFLFSTSQVPASATQKPWNFSHFQMDKDIALTRRQAIIKAHTIYFFFLRLSIHSQHMSCSCGHSQNHNHIQNQTALLIIALLPAKPYRPRRFYCLEGSLTCGCV